MSGIVGPGLAAYFAEVALGASSRAAILALPLCLLQIAVLARAAFERSAGEPFGSRARRLVQLTAAALGVAFVLVSLRADVGLVARRRAFYDDNLRVEQTLRTAGLTRAAQVFASDPWFYLPGFAPAMPYTLGGWPRVDLFGFEDAYPRLCVASLECFLADANHRGVRFLALHAGAGDLLPELGEIFRGERSATVLRSLGTSGTIRAFALETGR
jgi:hypothetical protein